MILHCWTFRVFRTRMLAHRYTVTTATGNQRWARSYTDSLLVVCGLACLPAVGWSTVVHEEAPELVCQQR
jgi:hypothetical protein